jgi:hypothetical protein
MTTKPPSSHPAEDFSVVVGGPLYGLLLRAHLLRPPVGFVWRRLLVFVAVTWLPLAILTAISGTLVGGVGMPFLTDLDAQVKFLFGLPLLLGTELLVHDRIRAVVAEFSIRKLIDPKDEARFDALVAWATRLRNSTLAEALLLLVALTAGHLLAPSRAGLPVSSWYSNDSSLALTRAGLWYSLVSQPVARFILFRWYFRISIWYGFLWRVSNLRLALNPLHPDRSGGLGFLEQSVPAFAPILVAQSGFVSAVVGNQILRAGASLPQFKYHIAGAVLFLAIIPLVPLTFFAKQLIPERIAGSYRFGRLATHYTNAFVKKWIAARAPSEEPLLGTSDIQSLADLANSYEVVRTMRRVPFQLRLAPHLALLIAVPVLPLALTMVPIEELAKGIINFIL